MYSCSILTTRTTIGFTYCFLSLFLSFFSPINTNAIGNPTNSFLDQFHQRPLKKKYFRKSHKYTTDPSNTYSKFHPTLSTQSQSISPHNGHPNRRNLLGRRSSRNTGNATVTVVRVDTNTGNSEIISEQTVENTNVDSSGSSSTENYVSFPGSFFQYNVRTNRLFQRETYPFASIKEPCTVADKSQLVYLIGGYDNETLIASNVTQMYDQLTDEWTILPEMNVARIYPTCHYFGDFIFVFGGCGDHFDCIENGTFEIELGSNNTSNDIELQYFLSIEMLDLNNLSSGWVLLNSDFISGLNLDYDINLIGFDSLGDVGIGGGLSTGIPGIPSIPVTVNLTIPRIGARAISDGFDNIWIIGGYDGTKTVSSIEALFINFGFDNGDTNIDIDVEDVIESYRRNITSINITLVGNFGRMIVDRASMAVGHSSYDTGYSCVIVSGGKSGTGSFSNLTVLDTQEYLCYASPNAVGCFESSTVRVNSSWFDDCWNDEWFINLDDHTNSNRSSNLSNIFCDYHNIITFEDTCYHGPFGFDIRNMTKQFVIIDDSVAPSDNLYNISIRLKYYAMCDWDENVGDEGRVYFNFDNLLWSGTHELNVCQGGDQWNWMNWTDTFVDFDAWLYQCVDNGNDIPDINDTSCFHDVVVNITNYNDSKFYLTVVGSVDDDENVKNWGFSDLSVHVFT